jgi:hypothetical protein
VLLLPEGPALLRVWSYVSRPDRCLQWDQRMSEPPAIFLLANDRVLANVVQLLYSFSLHEFKNKLFYIPFDQEMYFSRSVFDFFGVQRYDVGLDQIDTLGRRIYDRDPPAKPYPYCLGKLRKLSFLTFPEAAVYLDADCIVTSKPDLFNKIFTVSTGIGYINTSPDGVYEDVPPAAELRRRSTFLTSGMIAKSEGALSIAKLEVFFKEPVIEKFHEVRRRDGYVDQPLWNFLVDSGYLEAADLLANQSASRVTSIAADLSLQPDGSVYAAKSPVLLLHLAGPALKNTRRYRFLIDGMLLGGLRELAAKGGEGHAEISRFLFTR